MDGDGTDWYTDACKRATDIRNGCIPPSVGITLEQLLQTISTYSKEDLEQYNYPYAEGSEHWTMGGTPMHIIGFTSDGFVAYYGINYIGAKSVDELRSFVEMAREKGDAQLKAMGAQVNRELDAYLASLN